MKTNTNTATDHRTETANRLADLMSKRNELLASLEDLTASKCPHIVQDLTEDKRKTVHTLCETIAQISVYKTLLLLTDKQKGLTTNEATLCEKMFLSFPHDVRRYTYGDISDIYTDAFDLFEVAYMTIWQYLNTTAPLTLDDIVLTIPKKNGDEKNYTLFQTACKSIRDYIHSWSKTDPYKRLHYCIGITEDGKQVTTDKRPEDDLTDISTEDRIAFFDKYGLTALEQETARLLIDGETAESIAELLGIPPRTARHRVQATRAKFATASLYAEYITARNAEKIAKAKAEKHETDRFYLDIYTKAQERTARALTEWQTAFHKANTEE